jgi:threonyl-tRNA synthetase
MGPAPELFMSNQITLTLPDGNQKQVEKGTTFLDFIKTQIGAGLAKAALFAKLDDQEFDLTRPIEHDGKFQVFTNKSPEGLELIRHDAAHVVASVVQKLFPGTQVTIGPAIENGFYYDFYRETPFTQEDLEKIEIAANEEVKKNLPFTRSEIGMDEAIQFFEKLGEKFKVEIVKDIAARGAKTLTMYEHGGWSDFCLGPHAPSTGSVGVIKIMSVAGAYWRGDPKNPQLQRVYGTAFPDKKQLDAYLHTLEEAKKRDHRKLGRELELFTFLPVSPGSAFWLPKGTTLFRTLSDAMRKLLLDEAGYQEIKTPLLYNKMLWEKSGHWGKYRENLFLILNKEALEDTHRDAIAADYIADAVQVPVNSLDTSLKPMNCPSHHLVFDLERRSYRELPLRFHTQDALHRNEESGALGGLTRVRQFHQDDAHIYLTEEQIFDEVSRLFTLIDKVYTGLGLPYEAKFSTRPDNFLGDISTWDHAEAMLEKALKNMGRPYTLKPKDGAFYGPKIDFDVTDALGRKWQCATIQLDYLAAQRFDLKYIGADNAEHKPVVIHRAIYGSFERFIAILTEHFAGAFPTWLAPVQARIITVSEKQTEYGRQVQARLKKEGFRVEFFEDTEERIQARIRLAELAKVPYAIVIGDKEVEANAVAPRGRGGRDLKQMPLDQFVELLREEAKVPWLS